MLKEKFQIIHNLFVDPIVDGSVHKVGKQVGLRKVLRWFLREFLWAWPKPSLNSH